MALNTLPKCSEPTIVSCSGWQPAEQPQGPTGGGVHAHLPFSARDSLILGVSDLPHEGLFLSATPNCFLSLLCALLPCSYSWNTPATHPVLPLFGQSYPEHSRLQLFGPWNGRNIHYLYPPFQMTDVWCLWSDASSLFSSRDKKKVPSSKTSCLFVWTLGILLLIE